MEKILLNTRPKKSGASNSENQANERRIGFYLRVSTEEQAENPEGSLKNQEERLAMTLRLKNGDDGETRFGKLQAVYCDSGRSGKDMNRPELQKLLRAIEAREINMVMVSELSRLSRSIRDFSQIWEFMQSHGCGFFSLRENFDTSNAAGEMLLFSIANFAQFERRQTSERVSANFLIRAQRGLWNGGVLPIGYEPDPEKRGSIKVVEKEAEVVRVAFQSLLDRGSVSQAAKWLNQNDYTYYAPLRGGGASRPRYRHFTFDSLHRLLSNPAYAGLRQIQNKGKIQIVKAVWPAIVNTEIFERAQKILEAGKRQKTGRESRYPYLLTTRTFCGECGSPLVGISAHGATTKVPYYGHGNQIKVEQTLEVKSHRCTPFRVSGRKLEERVWKEVLALIESPSHRQPLFQVIQKLGENQSGRREMERKESELLTTTEKLANLARRVAELPAGVPAEAFYDEMKRLGENKTKLETLLLQPRQGDQIHTLATRAQYNALLEKLKSQLIEVSPESKRRIIHALIHKVVITQSGLELHYFSGADQIKTGEAGASPSLSLSKKISGLSSFKQLNGGHCRD